MIAYIFSENELVFLCSLLNINVLPRKKFENKSLSTEECNIAAHSLEYKGVVICKDKKIKINKGISSLLSMLEKTDRLLISAGKRDFAAYISNEVSAVLADDRNSNNLLLIPFENETALYLWLKENNLCEWTEIRKDKHDE